MFAFALSIKTLLWRTAPVCWCLTSHSFSPVLRCHWLGWFEDWSPNSSGVLDVVHIRRRNLIFRALALPDSVGVAQDVLLSACCSWGRDSQSRRGSQGEDDWHRRPNTCRKGGNILFLKFYPSFATIRAPVPHFRPAWRWLRCFKYPRRSVKKLSLKSKRMEKSIFPCEFERIIW